MLFNKKILISIFLIVVIFFIIVLSFLLKKNSSKTTNINIPTQIRPTIMPSNNNNQNKSLEIQTQADKDFGDWQKKIIDKYPWYTKLLLQSKNYFVYFDLEKDKIFAKLYLDNTIPGSFYEKINVLKNEIMAKLQELQIPITQNQIEWVISK